MNNAPAKPAPPATTKPSALALMASRFCVEPAKLLGTLKNTAFKGASDEEMMALVVVANEYGLNPFTREIYAFPKKGGGIVPVIAVDGWIRIANEHEAFDGVEFAQEDMPSGDVALTCTIYRKDRTKPTAVREFLHENRQDTGPWNQWPMRMLRHRAFVQCARLAFGFAGFADEDEARVFAVIPDPMPRTVVVETTTEEISKPAASAPVRQPALNDKLSPQEELAAVVVSSGYTFEDFRNWAGKTGNVAETDSLGSFDDIPPAIATRILRAKAGLLAGLAEVKGGGQ